MRSRSLVLLLALSACSVESPPSISKVVRLPDAYVGAQMSELVARGGEAAAALGALPAGLTLSSDGVLSGRPEADGDYALAVALTGPAGSRVETLALAVRAPPALHAAAPAEVVVGAPQRWALSADGGARPMHVEVLELPPGMHFDGPAIGGAVELAGRHAVHLRLRDANGRTSDVLSTVVATPPLTVRDGATAVYAGEVVEIPLTASGGRAPFSWTLVSGALPAGLALSADGRIAGVVSDAADPRAVVPNTLPIERAPLFAVLRATDASGQDFDSTMTFEVVPAPRISSLRLPDVYAGEAVRLAVALAGLGTRLVAATSDAAFNAEGAVLSGEAGAPRETAVNVVAEDAFGRRDVRSLPLSVLAPPRVETQVLPEPMVGQDYGVRLAASGGRAPYRWRIDAGALPAGLALVGDRIEGTPAVSGERATLTVVVEDANGREDHVPFDISVLGRGHAVKTAQLPDAYVGETFDAQLVATPMLGGAIAWSATGLPGWLALDAAGRMSGAPLEGPGGGPVGNSVFAVVARDGAAVAVRTLQLATRAPLTYAPAPVLAFGGESFSAQLTATGGRAPLTFEALALPQGVALDSDGTVHGAVAAGERLVAFRVRDANGHAIEATELLRARPALVLDQALVASGGLPPYRLSLAPGAPQDVALADGRLTTSLATPVAATVFVEDAAGQRRAATIVATAARE